MDNSNSSSETSYAIRQRNPFDWSVVEETQGLEISMHDIIIPRIVSTPRHVQDQRPEKTFELSLSPIENQEVQRLKRQIEELKQDNEDLVIETSVLRVEKQDLNRKLEMTNVKVDHHDHEIRRKNE